MHIEDAHDSALVDDIAVDIQPELPAEVSYRRRRMSNRPSTFLWRNPQSTGSGSPAG
jgi:hypothetical protein